MTKHKHEKHPMRSNTAKAEHDPYWMRAHQDWKFWSVVVLMLIAISTFVMTGR